MTDRKQVGVWRLKHAPSPPPETLTTATRAYDPRYDAPAGEERLQLIVSNLWLTKHREVEVPPATAPKEGLFAGKRLLIKAQALENGANGRRLMAVQFFWPIRGTGAETGSLDLSLLDRFFERVLGRIPRPGTFLLADLIGLNFMATVRRGRRRIQGEIHPMAYFLVEEPDACRLYDGWASYPPLYPKNEEIFRPAELAEARI